MESAPRTRHGHSRRGEPLLGEQILWSVLCGAAGAAVASDAARSFAIGFAVLGGGAGAAAGAALARQLTRALPAFGLVVGPLVTLTLMNLPRFTTQYTSAPAAVARRGGAQQLDMGVPTLPYFAAALGVLASALLASVLLHALSLRVRGDRRPMRNSLRGLAWICFWVTLATVLISHFAPI
jgi:hypothetical protein